MINGAFGTLSTLPQKPKSSLTSTMHVRIIIDGQALVQSIGKPAEAKIAGDFGDTFAEAGMHLGQSYQKIMI